MVQRMRQREKKANHNCLQHELLDFHKSLADLGLRKKCWTQKAIHIHLQIGSQMRPGRNRNLPQKGTSTSQKMLQLQVHCSYCRLPPLRLHKSWDSWNLVQVQSIRAQMVQHRYMLTD